MPPFSRLLLDVCRLCRLVLLLLLLLLDMSTNDHHSSMVPTGGQVREKGGAYDAGMSVSQFRADEGSGTHSKLKAKFAKAMATAFFR